MCIVPKLTAYAEIKTGSLVPVPALLMKSSSFLTFLLHDFSLYFSFFTTSDKTPNQKPPKTEICSILEQLERPATHFGEIFQPSLINTSRRTTGDKDRLLRLTILEIKYILVNVGRFSPN